MLGLLDSHRQTRTHLSPESSQCDNIYLSKLTFSFSSARPQNNYFKNKLVHGFNLNLSYHMHGESRLCTGWSHFYIARTCSSYHQKVIRSYPVNEFAS